MIYHYQVIIHSSFLFSLLLRICLDPLETIPVESSPTNVPQKHKSLISIYDNSNDGEQQNQQKQQQQINLHSLPLVGILGRNQRAHVFAKRLLTSGFPKPIQCDINSNQFDLDEKSNYVSYETFLHQSPSIILITENLEQLFNLDKHQQLIIDVREVKSPHILLSISDCYQAFGNLSDWEIENGAERTGVAVVQSSPRKLLDFIHQFNCFSRGISLVDSWRYNQNEMKSFRQCTFPFITMMIVFSLCFIFSMFEYRKYHSHDAFNDLLFRQASSITAGTSLTLLSLLFFIRPLIETMKFISKKFLNNRPIQWKFLQLWLQSRRHFAWYSMTFALLHVLFLVLIKTPLHGRLFFLPTFFGLLCLSVLVTLTFVYFPWLSERLLWREYYFLTSYLGPFGLLMGFIHVLIHWKYDYHYLSQINQRTLFTLKFLSMILPLLVLVLRLIIYGIVYPINQLIDHRERKSKTSIQTKKKKKKDTALLP